MGFFCNNSLEFCGPEPKLHLQKQYVSFISLIQDLGNFVPAQNGSQSLIKKKPGEYYITIILWLVNQTPPDIRPL